MNWKRERSFLYHASSMTLFSPLSSLYQTTVLFNLKLSNFFKNIRYVPNIFPQQVILRYGQLHVSTLCRDNISPIPAFGIIGILQGGIYGHSTLYFSNRLCITNNIKISDYFRGPVFAASRDIVSQGIPFLLTDKIAKNIFEENAEKYHYPVLFGLSALTTSLSNPLHCMQIFTLNNRNKSQLQIAIETCKTHKWSLFYKGIESRFILLSLTNLFNDIFLKDLWMK